MAETGFIGYNPERIKELMQTVKNTYTELGNCMADGWSSIPNTLQANWKGVDEQDFEEKFANRMIELYLRCTELVQETVNNINILAQNWQTWQNQNVLTQDGGVGHSIKTQNYDFEVPTIEPEDLSQRVKRVDNDFAGQDLGIVSGAQSTIGNAMNDYMENIKAKVLALYNEIDSSTAFLGNQSGSINEFLNEVGRVMGEASTDIKDMLDSLGNVTDLGYSSADEEASSAFRSAAQNSTQQ